MGQIGRRHRGGDGRPAPRVGRASASTRASPPGQYDVVLVLGATVPHEVAGFAGGAKYFFPGVAGPELTHLTHWLGALATIERVIGRIETPTRRLIETAAAFVPAPSSPSPPCPRADDERLEDARAFRRRSSAQTVRRAADDQPAGARPLHRPALQARRRASSTSTTTSSGSAARRATSSASIIERGGELIIYAPHLSAISLTHGALIEKYGYAPLERVRDMVEGSDELRANLCVAAHLAHVAYAGDKGD